MSLSGEVGRKAAMRRRDFLKMAPVMTMAFGAGCLSAEQKGGAAFRGVLIDGFATNLPARAADFRANAVVTTVGAGASASDVEAFKRGAKSAGLSPAFWVEVGRSEETARARPEWLHTPQHDDWLKNFPEFKAPKAAVFPWLPLNNRSVFDFQIERVLGLAQPLREGDVVFLNNVQNSPAGCGCGNLQCRSWDNSPGEKVAPSPYDHADVFFTDMFVRELARRRPELRFVPVLCPECERGVRVGAAESPEDSTGYCRDINCSDPCALFYYPGLVRALARLDSVALLCAYKELRRDLPMYGGPAGWVAGNVGRYLEHGPKRGLIAVLQGWGVSDEELSAQVRQAAGAGADSYLISTVRLDQSYSPVAI
jgi:hypothetical protein